MPGAIPPTGPAGPIKGPGPTSQSQQDSKYAFLLKSPFAKMFQKTGATPTVKQMMAIMNGVLMGVISNIKEQDAQWKKVYQKMKREIEGDDN